MPPAELLIDAGPPELRGGQLDPEPGQRIAATCHSFNTHADRHTHISTYAKVLLEFLVKQYTSP